MEINTSKLDTLASDLESLSVEARWSRVIETLDSWTEAEICAALSQLQVLVAELPGRAAPSRWIRFDKPHAAWPLVRRLRIWDEGVDDETLKKIAQFEPLRYVTHLELPENSFGLEGVRALAASNYIKNLVHLDLAENALGAEGIEAIAASKNLSSLESLDIAQCRVSDEGVAYLASSPIVRGLKSLNLHKNGLTDQATKALANSAGLEHLQVLYISMNAISNEGASELFQSSKVRELIYLEIWGNELKDEAIIHLSGNAPHLETLEIGYTKIGPDALKALANSHASKSLVKLKLGSTSIGDEGARVLLNADFPALKELDIAWCEISEEMAKALRESPKFAGLNAFEL